MLPDQHTVPSETGGYLRAKKKRISEEERIVKTIVDPRARPLAPARRRERLQGMGGTVFATLKPSIKRAGPLSPNKTDNISATAGADGLGPALLPTELRRGRPRTKLFLLITGPAQTGRGL
ncbi:hypothetical protein GWI33_001550 [Rhynchophorus ferrugineus]|uniref:Uncharacterized protein n=1 Tax=Rhynchophorus ferrugineus TaxID=354439 RepID=A0A834IL73_RHYFE|nr:hypothetical protein GWI33_001550 [Rhynchophorus ferrugineus]